MVRSLLCFALVCRAVKLPWIFPGALLIFNRAPGNIQGNLDRRRFGALYLSGSFPWHCRDHSGYGCWPMRGDVT